MSCIVSKCLKIGDTQHKERNLRYCWYYFHPPRQSWTHGRPPSKPGFPEGCTTPHPGSLIIWQMHGYQWHLCGIHQGFDSIWMPWQLPVLRMLRLSQKRKTMTNQKKVCIGHRSIAPAWKGQNMTGCSGSSDASNILQRSMVGVSLQKWRWHLPHGFVTAVCHFSQNLPISLVSNGLNVLHLEVRHPQFLSLGDITLISLHESSRIRMTSFPHCMRLLTCSLWQSFFLASGRWRASRQASRAAEPNRIRLDEAKGKPKPTVHLGILDDSWHLPVWAYILGT